MSNGQHDPKAVELGLRDAANACSKDQSALHFRLIIAADTIQVMLEQRKQFINGMKFIMENIGDELNNRLPFTYARMKQLLKNFKS